MNLERTPSHLLLEQPLDLPHNCQKSGVESCDATCGTGHHTIEPQPGKASVHPEEGTHKLPELETARENY
jgi:hypothetical protein